MKFTIGFSPCPNDTFIFDALVNQKIDTEGWSFDCVLQDVEALNRGAIEATLDITKVSYGVLPLLLESYDLLDAGSALGRGVGPLLITAEENLKRPVEDYMIAIPGENTTAHLLFSLAYPKAYNKIFLRYDDIEQFVQDGNGLGVIIHENRFTYQDKGLFKITDLGDYWEKETGNPIPLGGIVMRNSFSKEIQDKASRLIAESIRYAYAQYPELAAYVKMHAQEMSEDVMRKHIDLYVNKFSFSLSSEGWSAVQKLMEVYNQVKKSKV